jgi:hypothetical protein
VLSWVALLLFSVIPTIAQVQTRVIASASTADLPDAPLPVGYIQQATEQNGPSVVAGSVKNANGNDVAGATATLENVRTHEKRVVTTSDAGTFRFDGVDPGKWTLTISATDFLRSVAQTVEVKPAIVLEIPDIVLRLQGLSTTVDVTLSQHDIAEEQLKDEEKQRVLGVIPNFYVSYVPNAAPLSAGQKLKLAARTMYDPAIFLGAGVRAGIQQARNTYPSFGQGAEGYAQRYGVAYGTRASSFFLGNALFPVIFRQDPRYFYQGTGTVKSRTWHAITSPFYCRGDNGRYQTCYSNILGNFAAGGVSNAFIPAADRNGAQTTIVNSSLNTLGGISRALMQEFVLPRFTRGRRPRASSAPPSRP